MKKNNRLRSVLVKSIKVIALLFAALIVTLGVWSFIISRQPPVVIPTPKMPKPNGYDFVVKAGDSLVDKDDVTWAAYRDTQHNYSLAQKIALVRRNVKALRLVRESFVHEYRMPPQRRINGVLKLSEFQAKTRTLARLLVLDGHVKAAVGRWGQAMESYLDCIRLGSIMPRGGPLIELLVGMSYEAIGRRPTWQACSQLVPAEARVCVRKLERIHADRVTLVQSLEEEKWTGLSYLRCMMPKERSEVLAVQIIWGLLYPFVGEHAQRDFFDSVIDRGRLSYTAAKNQDPNLPSKPLGGPMWRHRMSTFDKTKLKYANNETNNLFLTATLALHAFRMEHGAYPSTLDELVPSYLSEVPEDLFAMEGNLRYKHYGKKYVLYSVGPDGKDDGGKAIFDPKGKNNYQKRYVQNDSKGDIVAGVNIY